MPQETGHEGWGLNWGVTMTWQHGEVGTKGSPQPGRLQGQPQAWWEWVLAGCSKEWNAWRAPRYPENHIHRGVLSLWSALMGESRKKERKKGEVIKRAGNPRGAVSVWLRLSKASSRQNCACDTLYNPNKQPPVDLGSASTWQSPLTEKSLRLLFCHPSLPHREKKQKNREERKMDESSVWKATAGSNNE